MRTVRTVSVSLERKYVEILERLARRVGSRSGALRQALDLYDRMETLRELESSYRDYFVEPGAAERERTVTKELISVSAWPQEGRDGAIRTRAKR